MKQLLVIVGVMIAVACVPAVAQQAPCTTYDKAIENLLTGYGETIQSRAMTSTGYIYTTTANLSNGSWSALVTNTSTMQTCLVASGQNFSVIAQGEPL